MEMLINTTRFGQLEVAEEACIHFPRGLYGLAATRDYCLLKHDDGGLFHWLQSTDEPAIAMVVTDPFRFFPSYEVEIPNQAADLLQARSITDVAIYTTVTVAEDGQSIHANLLGPLVINRTARLGMQLVQDGSRYTARHPIPTSQPVEEAA
jgi:flagellar assembly factor FliW